MSPDSTLLAGGFEDSSVALWRLAAVPLPSTPTLTSNSHITLAADYIYKDESQRQVNM